MTLTPHDGGKALSVLANLKGGHALFERGDVFGERAGRAFADDENSSDVTALLADQVFHSLEALIDLIEAPIVIGELRLNRLQDLKDQIFSVLGHTKNIT